MQAAPQHRRACRSDDTHSARGRTGRCCDAARRAGTLQTRAGNHSHCTHTQNSHHDVQIMDIDQSHEGCMGVRCDPAAQARAAMERATRGTTVARLCHYCVTTVHVALCWGGYLGVYVPVCNAASYTYVLPSQSLAYKFACLLHRYLRNCGCLRSAMALLALCRWAYCHYCRL